LIIDNNSRDHTPGVADEFRERLPVRYFFEANQGLSHSRNRAIREALGEGLIFTDDDVRPNPCWLNEYVMSFRIYHDAEYFGGRIVPYWPGGKPKWVRDINMPLLGGLFGSYDQGNTVRYYAPGDMHPYGANFALRRSLFERLERFRVDLGMKGSVPGRGEEAEYFLRAQKAGARGLYVPDAAVLHRVEAARLDLEYLYRFGVQKGIASKKIELGEDKPKASSEVAYLVRGMYQLLKGRGDCFRQCIINMGIQRGLRQQYASRCQLK
jgi:glucosyl-dolichyl phosphate glucuronosyltransferase